ncbi:MAG: TOBE domain-containing protein, partial [Rhodoferax sp.]|nr:TOBE domain-containing protein [Rhodoferax sp.]
TENEETPAVLRSENLGVRAAAQPGDTAGLNTLHGTVADVQYMGAHVEYAVDVNGVELTAWSPDEYEKGAAVLVTFSPEHVHLLPPQG